MINRRLIKLFICIIFVAYVAGSFVPAYAKDPQFRTSLSFTFSTISPFPDYDKKKLTDVVHGYVSAITPTPYIRLVRLVRGEPYEYNFDGMSQSVTYTKLLRDKQKLIPVTSDYNIFVDRRLDIQKSQLERSITRKSLTKAQNKKAGGLLRFTIPIQSKTFESVFGEGGASLKVSGYRKITFSGRSSWTDKPQTAYHRQSKFPTLQMEQVYRFNIEGTIGSKITVRVSQDSNNDIPLANRLLLRYKGGEDDILQSIEAGNTTLNLPATRFLQYSTRVQGLFGLKATARLADLSITAIASQEKGSTETMEINAGGSATATTVLKDVNYKKNTFFDLGRLPLIRSRRFGLWYPDPNDPADSSLFDFRVGDSIMKVIVYVDDNTKDDAERFSRQKGICYIDPEDTTSSDSTGVAFRKEGYFNELDESEYYFNPTQFYIQFLRRALGSDDLMGVYMEVARANGTIDTIGQLASGNDPLRLKLIKPVTHLMANYHVWEYEWRNVYDLRAKNIDLNDLNIKIYKGRLQNSNAVNPDDPDNQDGVDYLRIFGLDLGNNNGNGVPDGEIDRNTPYIDRDLGYLIFPSRHPFDSRLVVDTINNTMVNIDNLGLDTSMIVSLHDSVPDIYRSANPSVVNSSSEYYIAITTKGRGSAQIDLGAANIIEGSEVVTYNGQRLIRDKDYTIDPNFGRLTLLDDKYTDLNANLSIMFEKAPFFSLSKKTLFGSRLEYAPNNDLKVGTTILYKSEKSTNRKPKIGEETSKITVWDADFSYKFENSLFTKMVNALPFYSTKTKSYMQLSGELAKSFPNPNVDGKVYIDDFEGSRENYSLGIYRKVWRHASRPVQLSDQVPVRGKVAWYNPDIDSLVPITEIYENRQVSANEDNGTSVLDILYKPVDSYISYTPDGDSTIVDTVAVEPENTWNGFMRNIPEGVTLQLQDAQLLEMRLKGDEGIMHIDLGLISEDINGDGKLNHEDLKTQRVLFDEEDVGLDGIASSEERPIYLDAESSDPAEDDFNLDDVWRRNGTENNRDDPDGGSNPDTEDPDYDGLELINDYFSYKIDLSDTTQFYVPGTKNEYGWKSLRIPLRDPLAIDTIIGNPSWERIQFVRIWFDSAGAEYVYNPHKVSIAAIDLVSTTWGDSLYIADSVLSGPVGFDVAVVNDEINGNYTPPPGVEGYHDQTRDVTEAEQSLLLAYSNLNAEVLVNSSDSGIVLAADTGLAVRKFLRASNLMGYGRLQAYVHGDADVDQDSVLFFFRIGSDKDAYYEYRTILKPGWDEENNIDIDFAEITGLKARLIADYQAGRDSSLIRIDESGKYLVKVKRDLRNPSLSSIQYFSMGVVNLNKSKTATGEVWIDELRLTDVRNDVGKAARFSVSGSLADLLTYNFGYSNQDAYFRGVSSSTKGGAANNLGSGMTKTSYSFSGTFHLDKFFPRSLEMRMPINFNWSQNVQEPLLRSGTDIIVPEDLKGIETGMTVSKGFGISESFSKKTKNIIFAAFLNRVRTSFKYNVTQGHSATQPNFFRERYTATASYNLSVSKPPSIQLLKWTEKLWAPFGISNTRLYLYPSNWTFSGTLSSTYNTTLNTSQTLSKVSRLDFRGQMSMSYRILDKLSGKYSFNTTRDLTDPSTVILVLNPKKFKLGVEQNYSQNFSLSYSPKFVSFLSHKVDYSSNYTDSYRSSRVGTDSTFFHNVGVKTNINFNVGFDHTKLIGTNKRRRGIRRHTRTTKGGGGAFHAITYPLTLIRYVTDAIKPISGTYRIGRQLSTPAIRSKADMSYRLGLTEDPGVEPVTNVNTGINRSGKSISRSISAKSGVSLFSGISADVSYGRDVRETYISNPSTTIGETWPDVKFNLRSMKGLWILGKLVNKLNPSSRFVRTVNTKQRTVDSYINEKSTKNSYSPLFSFTLNPTRSMRTSIRIEKDNNETRKYNGSTGKVTNITRRSSKNYGITYSYSFKNPKGIKLPIFGWLRVQSSLTFSLDVSYRLSKGESAGAEDKYGNFNFSMTEDNTSLSIQPKASYSFSSTVTGGMRMRWQDTHNARQHETRHTREVSFWVEMRF